MNRQELAALDYDTSCFDAGEEFVDPAHLYAYDLDVFGTHSLFQYVNRTCTEPGKRLLANWLGQHLQKEDILERQAAVRELAPELQFRQHFRILGMLHKGTAADETELKAWAASPRRIPQRMFLRLLPATVTGINGMSAPYGLAGYLPGKHVGSNLDTLRHRRVCLYRKDYQNTSCVRQETTNPRYVCRAAQAYGSPPHAMQPAEKH